MKPAALALAALVAMLALFAGATVSVVTGLSAGPRGPSAAPSPDAIGDIPPAYLALYTRAGHSCPGLDWAVLAGIGKVETNHGRARLPGVHAGENSAGAGGPMQFLAATFAAVTSRHRPPAGGAHPPSRYDPSDAIYTAAVYLCDAGAPDDLEQAVFTYNHSTAYVHAVLGQAARYRADRASSTSGR